MFIKLYKVNKRNTQQGEEFYLTEVSVNISQISFMTENLQMKTMLNEGKLNMDLHKGVTFTDLRLNGKEEITVIGSPSIIESKIIHNPTKTLLRG
jgi:hypothetical protein